MKVVHIFILLILIPLLLSVNPALCQDNSDKVILVSHDFTEIVTSALVESTSIKVRRAIPENYSPEIHKNYLKKQWLKFAELSEKADSAVFVSAFWREDPLYAYSRRANIRIVPIDMAKPLDNSRAGIPVTELSGSSNELHYLWNSPGNCARMSDILASDLIKLYPLEAERITDNLDNLKRDLFKLRTLYEIAFGELEAFEAISFTTDFIYLTDEFGINMVNILLKPEHKWVEKDYQLLKKQIEDNDIRCIITKWEPKDEIKQVIKSTGANYLVLHHFKKKTDTPPAQQLINFYKDNLSGLLAILKFQ